MSDIFRPATATDANRCWEILQQGKAQMFREGKHQWTHDYPSPDSVTRDIANGYAYVIERDGLIIAYGAMVFDGEPAYEQIHDKWLSNDPYVVVHRLAVADEAKRQGVAATYFRFVEKFARSKGVNSFKVDTNYDNFYMHHLLKSLHFVYCGDVVYPQGSRFAYQKILR